MKSIKKTPVNHPETAAPIVEKSARALAKYLRIGPRKIRGVVDTIRHKPVSIAFGMLTHMKQKGARLTEKVLKSAAANAKGLGMDENRLVVWEIRVDGGPMMKRFLSRSQGRADKILKRMSHLTIVLREGRSSGKDEAVQAEAKNAEGSSKEVKAKSRTKAKTAAAGKA
jgi:large subunit ribosomal protein L22